MGLSDAGPRAMTMQLSGDRGSTPGGLASSSSWVPSPLPPMEARRYVSLNASVRQNRLALLQDISALADGRADFSELEGF